MSASRRPTRHEVILGPEVIVCLAGCEMRGRIVMSSPGRPDPVRLSDGEPVVDVKMTQGIQKDVPVRILREAPR